MRFSKGSKVEVLSKKDLPIGTWLCAEIISGNGHTYSVKYGWFPMAGEALVERVPRKAIRPCPPPVEGMDNWVPGDHVEVFQNMSWKTGTVMKALGGNNYLVRILGASEEFRAHSSHLRIRLSWQDDKWFLVGKGDVYCTMAIRKKQTDANAKLYVGVKKNVGIPEGHISSRTLKRALPDGLTYSEAYNVAFQKVRSIEKGGGQKRIFADHSLLLLKNVDACLSPQEKLGEKFLNTSSCVEKTGCSKIDAIRGKANQFNDKYLSATTMHIDADSSASSVGSCCINGNISYRLPSCSIEHANEDIGSFCSDAESFCGQNYEEENEELVGQDHRLELHAYHSAMKALHASGPLTWEDEMRVTDLRRTLHISNDEHLVELRNLIAADARIPIC